MIETARDPKVDDEEAIDIVRTLERETRSLKVWNLIFKTEHTPEEVLRLAYESVSIIALPDDSGQPTL
ncbi:MAG: hypothetical protein H7A21_18810 [Spirochaetales bacterium]|nr:hypothetical protein [Leptospiraceae bacterium]MCP5483495.1 hypothetical protein [Spirochaetales bacterium]MCP5486753.1 hypothetical protein [Spirochaetales bacterium]